MLSCRGYVTVSRCAHEYQLPALFRLWPRKGTASQVQLAAELTELLGQVFPGREVHGAGDAALQGEALVIKGTTWTTRLPGQRGHLRAEAPADRAARSAAGDRGADRRVQGRRRRGLARGDRPDLRQAAEGAGRRVPGTVARQLQGRSGPARPDARAGLGKPYELGIFTLDTRLPAAEAIERYSWRWPIEPSNATGKQVTAGDMHAALRDALTSARINTISQGGSESRKTVTSTLTSEAQPPNSETRALTS